MYKHPTEIDYLTEYNGNNIYIKREDLNYPPFGGNKVRKLNMFLKEALDEGANYIVTYGAPQSNHCRLTVSMAKDIGLDVLLILAEGDKVNYNGNFMFYDLYDIEIVWTRINQVPETIDKTLQELQEKGNKPYFIQGGGHGDLGTHAFKEVFDEILLQESTMGLKFDEIYHASGTGTTQAGLISGNIINNKNKEIIGISIARGKDKGLNIIKDSVDSYMKSYYPSKKYSSYDIVFLDNYIGEGYADIYPEVNQTIKNVIKRTNVILDPVYTGKAFYGMIENIKKNNIRDKDILFIHTGGLPLIFNYADSFKKE